MKNAEIRNAIKKAGLHHWQVADEIGISHNTICIWLRHELDGEKLERVRAAIQRLKGGGVCESAEAGSNHA